MNPNDEGFLRTICEAPDDDLPRLIFADWLDEHGDPRGEFIRLQIELARGPSAAGASALEERERQLLFQHRSAWLHRLDPEWRGDAVFERGFIAEVTVGALEFIRNADRWLRYQPILKVALYGAARCIRNSPTVRPWPD